MALHDRLKPVQLDELAKPTPAWHAIAMSGVIALVAAGMAFAMPYAVRRASVRPVTEAFVQPSPRATTAVVLPDVEGDDDDHRKGSPRANQRDGKGNGQQAKSPSPTSQSGGGGVQQPNDDRGDKKDAGTRGGTDDDDGEEELPVAEDKGNAPDHAGGPDDSDSAPGSSGGDHGKGGSKGP